MIRTIDSGRLRWISIVILGWMIADWRRRDGAGGIALGSAGQRPSPGGRFALGCPPRAARSPPQDGATSRPGDQAERRAPREPDAHGRSRSSPAGSAAPDREPGFPQSPMEPHHPDDRGHWRHLHQPRRAPGTSGGGSASGGDPTTTGAPKRLVILTSASPLDRLLRLRQRRFRLLDRRGVHARCPREAAVDARIYQQQNQEFPSAAASTTPGLAFTSRAASPSPSSTNSRSKTRSTPSPCSTPTSISTTPAVPATDRPLQDAVHL